MDPAARVNLLGPSQLLIHRNAVAASPFHFALLALFALKETNTISRSEVAALLWPEASSASGRHSLSQLVYTLNRAAGASLIKGDRTRLVVGQVSADVHEFRAAVQAADWPMAAELFRGELLQGIEFARAPAYENWVAGFRIYYSEWAVATIEGLYLNGQRDLATGLAARLPAHLASAVGLTETYWASLRLDPEGRCMRDPDLDKTAYQEATPGFVGRRQEIDWLEKANNLSNTEGFRVVVMEGEPGVGKTALATRFGRIRALRGSCVLFATAFEAEKNVPFGIVAQWIRELGEGPTAGLSNPMKEVIELAFFGDRRERRGSHAASDPTTDPAGEFRLLEALRQLFLSKSASRPLLLILDDAHLADAASIGFVHYFYRRSAGARVLFLASLRIPNSHGISPFGGWREVHRLQLDPLLMQDMALLLQKSITSLDAVPTNEYIEDLYQRTGGNPLLLLSLLAAEDDKGTDAIPVSVLEFFMPRLDQLSEEASVLLAAIAIAGQNIDLEVAGRISGILNWMRVGSAIRELETAALVLCDPNGEVRPRHGIVAEVAILRLAGSKRRSLYGRAARVLSEEGQSPPSILAVKHDIGGDREHAFNAALSAAAASRDLHATREREFFLKLALSNAPDPESEARIRVELADLFRDLGRPSEGLDIARDETIQRAPAALRSRARASRLAIQLRKVDIATDLRVVWDEIDGLAEYLDPEITADLYHHLAAAAHDLGRTGDAIAGAKQALAVAQQLPTSASAALIATRSAMIVALYLGVDEGLSVIDRLLPAVQTNLEALAQCLGARGTVLIAAGRLVEAEQALLRGVELMERCCLYGSIFGLHNNLGVCYMEQGRFHEARTQLEEATRFGREFLGPSGAAIAADNMAMLRLEEGDHHAALDIAQCNVIQGTSLSSRWLFHRHGIVGLCSLELGLLAQAFESKREIELLFDQHEYWSNDVSYVETFLARMLVLEDRAEEARERLETAIEVYRPRDLLCRARLELELARIDLKRNPRAAVQRSEAMLETLRGTGARPLIDRFEEMADRAQRRHPA